MSPITIPYPPSANRYWRSVKGRVLVSKEARSYKLVAAVTARRQGMRAVDGPVVLWLDIFRPQRSGDLDNFIKVTLDALKGIAFGDDSQVVEIHARRFDDKHKPRVEVRVGTTPPPPPPVQSAAGPAPR